MLKAPGDERLQNARAFARAFLMPEAFERIACARSAPLQMGLMEGTLTCSVVAGMPVGARSARVGTRSRACKRCGDMRYRCVR